ncbi:hypothetical protein SK128_012756 [Halocaridina rubra]|uniref:Uncharacterized protein n=1 Tax=Halocaridina rubra TaxID=373956 RepID=A0AAN8X364_HALRR
MEVNVAPCHSLKTRCQVLDVQFSPFEWSSSLLAVAFPASVAVYSVAAKEEGDGIEECTLLKEWHVASEPICLAWSPSATLRANPKCLQLSVATAANSVMEITSDLCDSDVIQDILSHKDFVNSISYNGETGNLVASSGDDLTARVWSSGTRSQIAKFLLTSPGKHV